MFTTHPPPKKKNELYHLYLMYIIYVQFFYIFVFYKTYIHTTHPPLLETKTQMGQFFP